MDGASSGHGAAWPLPHVLNAALHAALHRAFVCRTSPDGPTQSPVGRSHAPALGTGHRRTYGTQDGPMRHFTDFWSVGPFPVRDGQWYFPRPADAQSADAPHPTLSPYLAGRAGDPVRNSLPYPWLHPVGDHHPPSKDKRSPWFTAAAWEAYLNQGLSVDWAKNTAADDAFASTEHNVGIGIDAATRTTGTGDAEGLFYSAHYLRLHERARLGLITGDSVNDETVTQLFPDQTGQIIVGGQGRRCTVETSRDNQRLPLPLGISDPDRLERDPEGHYRIRWALLTPAIWPRIEPHADSGDGVAFHHGGWLPNWISPELGLVRLQVPPLREPGQSRKAWRGAPRRPLPAQLVAALVPKPIAITGWSAGVAISDLPGIGHEGRNPGPKSTHLAVPGGAVYYFTVEPGPSSDPGLHAREFLAALNWHGSGDGTEVLNRRSSVFGEKGFGLGVCGSWSPLTQAPDHVGSVKAA